MTVEQIGVGRYKVSDDGRHDIVYVAGPAGRRWACWNGRVFREEEWLDSATAHHRRRTAGVQHATAPMPATVLKVLVSPGQRVGAGDTLVIVEAMKMEMPLRASADATVMAVCCREGELVQPDVVLIELA